MKDWDNKQVLKLSEVTDFSCRSRLIENQKKIRPGCKSIDTKQEVMYINF